MKHKLILLVVFLVSNFLALAIGTLLMDNGPQTNWYTTLNQAPWTPANWVFGVAWTTIMILFSFYMTKLSFETNFLEKKIVAFYVLQWILNVSWNYLFFNKHWILIGLLVIILLWLIVTYIMLNHLKKMKSYTLLILPYFVWMTIAVSLNAYIYVFN